MAAKSRLGKLASWRNGVVSLPMSFGNLKVFGSHAGSHLLRRLHFIMWLCFSIISLQLSCVGLKTLGNKSLSFRYNLNLKYYLSMNYFRCVIAARFLFQSIVCASQPFLSNKVDIIVEMSWFKKNFTFYQAISKQQASCSSFHRVYLLCNSAQCIVGRVMAWQIRSGNPGR